MGVQISFGFEKIIDRETILQLTPSTINNERKKKYENTKPIRVNNGTFAVNWQSIVEKYKSFTVD